VNEEIIKQQSVRSSTPHFGGAFVADCKLKLSDLRSHYPQGIPLGQWHTIAYGVAKFRISQNTVYTTLYLPFPMRKLPLFVSSTLVLSFFFALGVTEKVHAYAGTDPNVYRRMNLPNFRLPVGSMERYRRNKRALSRAGDLDTFTSATGAVTTFHRREDYLRATQLRRIQEVLEKRKYSGVRRTTRHFWDREDRTHPTTVRRINEAKTGGGIRHGVPGPEDRDVGRSSVDRKALIEANRAALRERDRQKYMEKSTKITNCIGILGRRYARCLYDLQTK